MTARRQPTLPEPEGDGPASTEEALGESLRALFDHVAEQPLSDDIMALVDELERKRLLEAPDED